MQIAKVSFINPIGQSLLKLTNWIVIPLQKILPKVRRFDLPCFLAAYLCCFMHIFISSLISYLIYPSNPMATALFSLSGALAIVSGALLYIAILFIYVLTGVILLSAILSWINPQSPLLWFTQKLSAPILEPIQKRIPYMAGLDFSPLIAILILQVLLIALNHIFY